MSTLAFTQVGDKYESTPIQLSADSVVELNFDTNPDYTGIVIEMYQTLSQNNWQICYHETMRTGLTFCKTIQGASEKALYKIVCSKNPSSALYE